jgi:hypothetical protein
LVEIVLALEVTEHERPFAAHELRVAFHHAEISADVGREVDFVDDQKIAEPDRRATLARDLVPLGNIDDVDKSIDQLGRKRRGKIVTAAFHQHELQLRKLRLERAHGLFIHRGVVADCGVRAPAGLDPGDALGRQRVVAREKLRVLERVDVVRHDRHFVAGAKFLAEL